MRIIGFAHQPRHGFAGFGPNLHYLVVSFFVGGKPTTETFFGGGALCFGVLHDVDFVVRHLDVLYADGHPTTHGVMEAHRLDFVGLFGSTF